MGKEWLGFFYGFWSSMSRAMGSKGVSGKVKGSSGVHTWSVGKGMAVVARGKWLSGAARIPSDEGFCFRFRV